MAYSSLGVLLLKKKKKKTLGIGNFATSPPKLFPYTKY